MIDKNSEYSRRRNELEAKHYGGEESACCFAVVGKSAENVRLYQLIYKNSEYSRRRNKLEAKHYGGEESACCFAVVGKLVV